MLTITMEDLYPGPTWSYVFGWAMYQARTGVFSFIRFDPSWNEEEDEGGVDMLYNSCHVMVHETGHMFGMTHCTYYECTMNGFNSYEEMNMMKKCMQYLKQLILTFIDLCPVCLRKLQSVAKFDVRERYTRLKKVC
jgi:archaemetzincin